MMAGAEFRGPVDLTGSHIDGGVDMGGSGFAEYQAFVAAGLHIGGGWFMGEAIFGGGADLHGAHVEGGLDMEGSRVADEQRFDAAGLNVGAGGLGMQNVKFGGPVDLDVAHIEGVMDIGGAIIGEKQAFTAAGLYVGGGGWFMHQVKFGGPVDLSSAHVGGGGMEMDGATIAGNQAFTAAGLYVGGGGWSMREVKFGGPVDLSSAHVGGGGMEMDGATIAENQAFTAAGLYVGGGGWSMREVMFGGEADLHGANVEGGLDMEGSKVAEGQRFDAAGLHVGAGGLGMQNVTFGGPVSLDVAHIEGALDMGGAIIGEKQAFTATGLYVGASGLFMRRVTFGGPVDLSSGHVGGDMDMDGANVAKDQEFQAERLFVGADLNAREVMFGGPVGLTHLRVDGALDLRGSHMRQLDVQGANITDDLVLGGRFDNSESWVHWDSCDDATPCLNLRNVKAGDFQDDERAWPSRITLEGFTYTHLGGIGGEQRQDMRNRDVGWWRNWLERDPVYSSQSYMQLASVLGAAGNRDEAADIRFFSRDRERYELLRGCKWLQGLGLVQKSPDERPCGWDRWGAWLGLTAVQGVVGYGIGSYGFRAMGWALVLALIGTVILCFSPAVRGQMPIRFLGRARRGPRQKSLLWCFGASLNRLLPLVTISQEFNEFFNDPRRERLHAWQHLAFGVLALCGWALGLFVVAAFSGLIQT